jgi:predicted secreted protein
MFVAALMLVSAQALADQSTVAAPVAPMAAAPAKAKQNKICRVDDADSGSHIVKRICLTAEEWQNRGNVMTNSSHSGFTGKPADH